MRVFSKIILTFVFVATFGIFLITNVEAAEYTCHYYVNESNGEAACPEGACNQPVEIEENCSGENCCTPSVGGNSNRCRNTFSGEQRLGCTIGSGIDPTIYCCLVEGLADDQSDPIRENISCTSPALQTIYQRNPGAVENDCDPFNDDDGCDSNSICTIGGSVLCCEGDNESFVGCVNEPEDDAAACLDCVGTVDSPTGKIWTEIGCLDPSPAGIITRMFQIAFGILGGVGILRLMQIGVLYQSQDQEKIKEAREMVFSLFAGIILMIMGIVILRFLGVNVLGLPDNFLGV